MLGGSSRGHEPSIPRVSLDQALSLMDLAPSTGLCSRLLLPSRGGSRCPDPRWGESWLAPYPGILPGRDLDGIAPGSTAHACPLAQGEGLTVLASASGTRVAEATRPTQSRGEGSQPTRAPPMSTTHAGLAPVPDAAHLPPLRHSSHFKRRSPAGPSTHAPAAPHSFGVRGCWLYEAPSPLSTAHTGLAPSQDAPTSTTMFHCPPPCSPRHWLWAQGLRRQLVPPSPPRVLAWFFPRMRLLPPPCSPRHSGCAFVASVRPPPQCPRRMMAWFHYKLRLPLVLPYGCLSHHGSPLGCFAVSGALPV